MSDLHISFEDLDLHPQIQKGIATCGYTTPTPIQAKSIPVALQRKDVVASAQTGSGKTASFVIPILNFLASEKPSRYPRALILTPTRELATQITTAARLYGKFLNFNIISLVGGMSYEPQIRDLKRGADIIVATPGRLIDHLENKRVDLSQIDILVLDEADRMVDMGFIEDVEIIAGKTPESRQTLFFSATLDKSIIKIVKRLVKDPVHIDLSEQQVSAPKIKQTLYKTKNMHHKTRLLKHMLNNENIFKAIIFTATKINADKLATELREDNFAAAPLHGDLRQNVRNRTIDAFRRGKVQFLIATDVAARGLDISDISHVFNYDLPKFNEDYVHRIGRTGRAGKEGEAISFFSNVDLRNLRNIEKYIGKRLTILPDNFVYAETSTNTRSDADQFSPENMLENNNRQGGRGGYRDRQQGSGGRRRFDNVKSYDDKPKRSFQRDDAGTPSDRPRRNIDRDESRSDKPFGEKRAFSDKKYNRDEPKSAKSFGEKRSFGEKKFDRNEPKSGKSFGDKRAFGERKFDRDESRPSKPFGRRSIESRTEDSDRPRKSFNRDDARPAKSYAEKRSFDKGNRTESSDRPRKSFNRDEQRSSKPFGDKRRSNQDSRSFGNKPRRNEAAGEYGFSHHKSNDKKPERKRSVFERPVYEFEQRDDNPRVLYKKRVDTNKPRAKFTRDESSKKSRDAGRKPANRGSNIGKNTKKPYHQSRQD